MAKNPKIELEFTGSATDSGHLRLSDFIEHLGTLKDALAETERIVARSQDQKIFYRIVDIVPPQH
jgi:hypothetical protein